MKRFLSIVISVVFILTIFAACGKTEKEDVPTMDLVQKIPAERVAKKTLTPAMGFAGGDGSKDSPYEISNAAELQYFANLFYDFSLAEGETIFTHEKKYQEAYYVLTNDIFVNTDAEMENTDAQAPTYKWEAIGRSSGDDNIQYMRFKGNFDGQNHFISGLYNCVLGDDYGKPDGTIGFFADLQNAAVSNLTIRNTYFYVYNHVDAIGGLASSVFESDIQNCHCENVKIYSHSSNGTCGLVGKSTATAIFSNCTVSGEVKGGYSSDVGGVISHWTGGTMKNCVNNAVVIAFENAIAGGICCNVSDASTSEVPQVIGCMNNGTISGESFGAGGIAARVHAGKGEILFTDCKNSGKITAKNEVGGIVGILYADQSTVDNKDKLTGEFRLENCENHGEISGETMIGGVVGHTWTDITATGKFSSCYNTGKISGSNIGGIVGIAQTQNASVLTVDGCGNDGEICGGSVAGGVVGFFTTTDESGNGYIFEIKNCKNKGNISNTGGEGRGSANDAIGGILGKKLSKGSEKDKFIISDCENHGSINAKSDVYAGGIAGYVLSTTCESKVISNCVNSSTISIDIMDYDEADTKVYNYAGGIVGTAQDTVALENDRSTGQFVLRSGNKNRIIYQDICGLTVRSDDRTN